MGRIVHALIEHKFPPKRILDLPKQFQNSHEDFLKGEWHWSNSKINEKNLIDIWNRKSEFFINNSWSEKDLALLEKDNMTLHFFKPNLVTFENSLNWEIYRNNEAQIKNFNCLAKLFANFINASDIIVVPDLGSVSFFYEEEDLTVNAYRQKANGNTMYAIEIS